MKLSEQTRIEAQIGFTIGILVGATAAGILLLFLTNWQWYFKLFSAIGTIGIIGNLALALSQLIKIRRNYLETMKEMESVNKESNDTIQKAIEELEKA